MPGRPGGNGHLGSDVVPGRAGAAGGGGVTGGVSGAGSGAQAGLQLKALGAALSAATGFSVAYGTERFFNSRFILNRLVYCCNRHF